MMVAPVSFLVPMAMSTVCFQAASSIIPTPAVEGQSSLLTSFVIHSWWLSPSCEPASATMVAASWALSRA